MSHEAFSAGGDFDWFPTAEEAVRLGLAHREALDALGEGRPPELRGR